MGQTSSIGLCRSGDIGFFPTWISLYKFLLLLYILFPNTLHFLSFFETLTAHTCFYIIMEFCKVLYSRLYNTIQIVHAWYNEPAKWEKSQNISQVLLFQCLFVECMQHPGRANQRKQSHEASLWEPAWGVSLSPILPVCHLVCKTDVNPPLANEDGPCLSPCAHSPCFQPVCTWLPAPKRQRRDCVSSDTDKLLTATLRSFMQAASKQSILLYERTTPRKWLWGSLVSEWSLSDSLHSSIWNVSSDGTTYPTVSCYYWNTNF